MNSELIKNYISSSEFNRCKRNGLNLFASNSNWLGVLKYKWLTRKLRRKIGHLWQLGCLSTPFIPIKPLYGQPPMYELMEKHFADLYLKAEDDFILKGMKND